MFQFGDLIWIFFIAVLFFVCLGYTNAQINGRR